MLLKNRTQLEKIIDLDYRLCDCQCFVNNEEFITLANRMIEIIRDNENAPEE